MQTQGLCRLLQQISRENLALSGSVAQSKLLIKNIFTPSIDDRWSGSAGGGIYGSTLECPAKVTNTAAEGTAWYLTDHLGTVRDIVDAAGSLVDHIEYDSFGNVVSETNATAGDRFKFTGREFDIESGLYYYRARYYDAATGRFLSEDSLGFDAGDANLYRYVGNAPTNGSDPFGLMAVGESSGPHSNVPKYAPTVQIVGCLASEAFFTIAFAAAGIPPDASDAAGAAQCFAGGAGTAAGGLGGTLADMLKSGQRADRGGLTKAGRAAQKHGDRAGSVFPKTTGGAAARNAKGQEILEEILTSANQRTRRNRYGGQDVFDTTTGRGARFDSNGNFMGFLEP